MYYILPLQLFHSIFYLFLTKTNKRLEQSQTQSLYEQLQLKHLPHPWWNIILDLKKTF